MRANAKNQKSYLQTFGIAYNLRNRFRYVADSHYLNRHPMRFHTGTLHHKANSMPRSPTKKFCFLMRNINFVNLSQI